MMQYIKILGASGNKTHRHGSTCIQVAPSVLIDAGHIITPLKEEARKIEHIFLTHAHIDHIVDLPFLVDLYYSDQEHTLNIYALSETIESVRRHLFNFEIYPDFTQINLQNSTCKALAFHPVTFGVRYSFDGVTLIPFETRHTVASCGYLIEREGQKIMFTSDTYRCARIWELLNNDPSITTLITEVSFPSSMQALAEASLHLTPKLLHEELEHLKRDDLTIFLCHLKSNYVQQLTHEIDQYALLRRGGAILHEGAIIPWQCN